MSTLNLKSLGSQFCASTTNKNLVRSPKLYAAPQAKNAAVPSPKI